MLYFLKIIYLKEIKKKLVNNVDSQRFFPNIKGLEQQTKNRKRDCFLQC